MRCISTRTTDLLANSSYLYADAHSALFDKRHTERLDVNMRPAFYWTLVLKTASTSLFELAVLLR